ncbi:MAG: tRNA (guanosine(37)-N1)-methyltransferase TrmD [Christensenellales bacterium]|jgi:tRNA (guanine37-N1)-methyltransferase
MRIDILTLFPEMIGPVMNSSMLGRAQQKGILRIEAVNIRDYAANKHQQADDYPFGGGAGMVMMPQPIHDCIAAVDPERRARRVYLSPRGRVLTPEVAQELAGCERLLLLCGHYEGVDQRVLDADIDEELSIGDYVLTGGELAAMVVVDCVSRFVPGVLGSAASAQEESFSSGLLEYPQYTRPAQWEGMQVPEVLLSGHHANILRWRRQQALLVTARNRPDLLDPDGLTRQDLEYLAEQGLAPCQDA